MFYTDKLEYMVAADAPYDMLLDRQYEEKLRLVKAALPYLPRRRQTVMTLYFRYGFSCKRLAEGLGGRGSDRRSRPRRCE